MQNCMASTSRFNLPLAQGSRANERGSVTVIFAMFALVLVGAVSWSLYVGQQVNQRIQLQNATDAGALATANHSAQGLNMIAANNLAIGASIHVAGAMPILASYGSILKLLDANVLDGLKIVGGSIVEVATGKKVSDVFQTDVWDKLKVVPALYMQTAAGTTRFNRFLADWWMIPAPVRTLEMTRANAPGAVVLPLQVGRFSTPGVMRWEGLSETSPKATVCHSIRASRHVGDPKARDNFLVWVSGPLHTINAGGAALSSLSSALAQGLEKLNDVLPIRFGFTKCGYGLKVPLADMISGVAGLAPNNAAANVVLDKVLASFRTAKDQFEDRIDDLPKSMCNSRGIFGAILSVVCKVVGVACGAVTSTLTAAVTEVQSTIQSAFSGSGKDSFQNKTIMFKAVMEMKDPNNKNTYECEDSSGVTHRGHVPVLDGNGEPFCLNIDLIRPYCIFRDELGGVIKTALDVKAKCETGNPGATMTKFLSTTDPDGCWGMVVFEQKGLERFYDDTGLEIASWGKQADAWTKGSGGNTPEIKRSLAFVFPKVDEEDFTTQNSLLTVAANPLRTTEQIARCPQEFQVETNAGDKWCMQTPMVGLSSLPAQSAAQGASGQTANDQAAIAFNSASGGLATLLNRQAASGASAAGALSSTLSRTQWGVAQVDLRFKPVGVNVRSFRNSLFVPAWRSQLVKVRPGDLAGGLGLVLGRGDNSTAGVITSLRPGSH
jgi:hypothetical protein